MKTISGLLFWLISALPSHADTLEWVMIYYMPYDNDLSVVAKQITNQFLSSRVGPNALVTLQVDLPGPGGLTRYIIGDRTDSIHLNLEHSARATTFSRYLDWVAKNYKARRYAIVLLSHGGMINEYGQDTYPANEWIPIDSLARAIGNFNRQAGIPRLDLFFEQVCMRGAIENLFEFKDIAQYTMASQDLVPAPNYYYPKVFPLLESTVRSGQELADLIVASDREDMYYSYVLIDNTKWEGWLERLERLADRSVPVNRSELRIDSLRIIPYGGEVYFDLVSFLTNAVKLSERDRNDFLDYTRKQLIRKFYANPKSDRPLGYCGLSVLSPFKPRTPPLKIFSMPAYLEFMGRFAAVEKK